MLRPQDGPTRERKSLNGIWDFVLDPDSAGHHDQWWRGSLPEAITIPVPPSYDDAHPDSEVPGYVGDAWFQRQFWVPQDWAGHRLVLRFDSVTHRAMVWVDNAQVAVTDCGCTPFEADITEHVAPGHRHRVTAVVTNDLTSRTIGPGAFQDTPTAEPRNCPTDGAHYAGVDRPVWLYRTPLVYVSDITVMTELNGKPGTVAYHVEAANAEATTLRVALLDGNGNPIATGIGATGTLVVPDAHRWQPGVGDPSSLEVSILDVDGEVLDQYLQNIDVPIGTDPYRMNPVVPGHDRSMHHLLDPLPAPLAARSLAFSAIRPRSS